MLISIPVDREKNFTLPITAIVIIKPPTSTIYAIFVDSATIVFSRSSEYASSELYFLPQ